MVKNHGVAKTIHDVGRSEIVRQLGYKARGYGRTFVRVDRCYQGRKRCSCCGCIPPSLGLSTCIGMCPACARERDRDVNAAINMREAGRAILSGAELSQPHEKSASGLAEP